jgi:hypothetical protein
MHRRAVVLALATALAACASPIPDTNEVGVFMPHHESSYHDFGMLALLSGRLRVENGCLVVGRDDGTGRGEVVVWAREFGLRRDPGSNALRIVDETGRVVAAVGEHIEMGGGNWPAENAKKYLGGMPGACARDTYFIGNVVSSRDQWRNAPRD